MSNKKNQKESNEKSGCVFTPLKCRAAPEATAPHTVLSFPPVSMCQWLSEGARLKLSFSWEGRGTTGSSQYSPPHSGSHLGRMVKSDANDGSQRQASHQVIVSVLAIFSMHNEMTTSYTKLKKTWNSELNHIICTPYCS